MTKKMILLTLCSLLLAPCSAVDAQQIGENRSHRFPGSKHCFWYRGPRGRVPARAEQAWMD